MGEVWERGKGWEWGSQHFETPERGELRKMAHEKGMV